MQQIGYHRRQLVSGEVDGAFHIVRDDVAQHGHRRVLGGRWPCRGRRGRGLLLEVEQVGCQLHRTDAVGHHVVRFHHERSALDADAFDKGELPQRSRTVETAHRGGACPIQQLLHAAADRQPNAAQVVPDVEVGIVDPAQRGGMQRHRHHLLAQRRDVMAHLFHASLQSIPVGCAVEQHHAHDRAAQQRVGLDHPHDGVVLAQVLTVRHLVQPPVAMLWHPPPGWLGPFGPGLQPRAAPNASNEGTNQ